MGEVVRPAPGGALELRDLRLEWALSVVEASFTSQ
jgi:hypothetical protein